MLKIPLCQVWAIADVNGDGKIDAKELEGCTSGISFARPHVLLCVISHYAVLMQQLNRGLPPSKFEVERTLEMILGGRAASAVRLSPYMSCTHIAELICFQTEQIEYGQFKRAMGMWLSPSVSATAAKKREALESDDLSVSCFLFVASFLWPMNVPCA